MSPAAGHTPTAEVLRIAAAEARTAQSAYLAAAARRDALIRKMRLEGSTLADIAAAAGLSAMAISKQLRRDVDPPEAFISAPTT